MIYRQRWTGCADGDKNEFPAKVPGNIQKDYADFHNWHDINYSDNCKLFLPIEDFAWCYKTRLEFEKQEGERVFFVSGGIDYIFDIVLNDEIIFSQEGMFKKIELDLTDRLLKDGNELKVLIHKHPKREDAEVSHRQADECCKPPVGYGWDWHPRVIPSGIWNDAYIETRKENHIDYCEVFYDLSEDYKKAKVKFKITCKDNPVIEFFSPDGECIYSGTEREFTVDNPMLWWCNGQGEAKLYTWKVTSADDVKTGRVGFRKIKLVNNHDYIPTSCLKPRNLPPMTISLNGRRIFAKGSNWANPEIFTGGITKETNTYYPLLKLAKDANMNILRCWGGAGCNKDEFYDLCDEMGLLIWQEFPLACNNYTDKEDYLAVLEDEARAIVRNLRHHPSIAMWCGGNELFNAWSGMNDQSLATRLINKVCYEEDKGTAFIPTSPIMGVTHGWYMFDDSRKSNSIYKLYTEYNSTAYVEFGVPGIAPVEVLKSIIPEDELFPPRDEGSWRIHHGFGEWHEKDGWACIPMLEAYFGKSNNIEELCERSSWTQCEGLKAIFEEARRQKPHCSMAMNWCFNEPWKTAANNSIISYPDYPKPSYYAVRDALRNVMPSARLESFEYKGREKLAIELWLLNDTYECVSDEVEAYIEIGDKRLEITRWQTGCSDENENIKGERYEVSLPAVDADRLFVVLKTKKYGESRYMLKYDKK